MEALVVVGVVIAFIVVLRFLSNRKRRAALFAKYGDESIVDKIMRRLLWQGMSEEQLIDSWGRPAAKDQKVYKTKITETFKYRRAGKNRFRSRVRVENGVVVGWEQK